MKYGTNLAPVLFAAALMLSACGGDEENTATDDGTATTEAAAPETTGVETTSPESTTAEDPSAGEPSEDCADILTADELNSILATSATISGSTKTCTVVFADDAVGTLRAFEGAQADEAIEVLIPGFEDEQASSPDPSGVLLDDGAGFIDDLSIVAVGESGAVFRLDLPADLEVADLPAATQELADLLLTR